MRLSFVGEYRLSVYWSCQSLPTAGCRVPKHILHVSRALVWLRGTLPPWRAHRRSPSAYRFSAAPSAHRAHPTVWDPMSLYVARLWRHLKSIFSHKFTRNSLRCHVPSKRTQPCDKKESLEKPNTGHSKLSPPNTEPGNSPLPPDHSQPTWDTEQTTAVAQGTTEARISRRAIQYRSERFSIRSGRDSNRDSLN